MAGEERQPPKTKKPKLDESAPVYRIFPPPSGPQRTFSINDVVYFRPKSAKEDGKQGKVVELVKDGHAMVRFPDQQPKKLSCKRLVPVFTIPADAKNHPLAIIFTRETIHYRHLACSQINEKDDVLEIGCSTGESSVGLCRYGRSWVGFDTSSSMIDQCKTRLEEKLKNGEKKLWHTCVMNALSDPTGALKIAKKFSGPKGPSAVFLDIGGNREEDGVVEMLSWVLRSFSNVRVIVVKSQEVVKDLNQCADSGALSIDDASGVVADGSAWLERQVKESVNRKTSRHPLQAPLIYSPIDPEKPICRYHNYGTEGCKKAERCPYDHEHCHLCLQKGHRAFNCGRD